MSSSLSAGLRLTGSVPKGRHRLWTAVLRPGRCRRHAARFYSDPPH